MIPAMNFFQFASLLMMAGTALAAEEEGFAPLFSGHDLAGWTNVNCAPETWTLRDGMIHCTGKPTGALRTTRQYENFILELDWRHLSAGGNSGVFIWATPLAAPGVPFLRGIEVQVLDNGFNVPGKNEWYTTHGDVFPIHGATMVPFGKHNEMRSFPSEERSKSSPEWNHYRIVCTNGVLRLSVNSKEVSGGEDCNYRKGYLGLESEGGPIDFRNIRLLELPSSGAAADLAAPVDEGWRSLFTGLDLRGWSTNSSTAQHWSVQGEMLAAQTGKPGLEGTLWTNEEFANCELMLDCRPVKVTPDQPFRLPSLHIQCRDGRITEMPLRGAQAGKYRRFVFTVRDQTITLTVDGKQVGQLTLAPGSAMPARFGLSTTGRAAEFMNLYVRPL
jgi:hypothetical protein